jgi:hypothetical protein
MSADYTKSPTGSLEMGKLSTRSIATGPGSRGGRWHEQEYRNAYHRAWRAAHPEYLERERLRRARKRVTEGDAADIVEPPTFPRPLPVSDHRCPCACGCEERVPVVACGFCIMGEHQ